ncbi:MAG TPA: type II toxin-antitoxin system prevent-host-death family antitoxin [Candidatus Tectomicrobia bacterium]|nr:type II toxin-antitoxin system prevent-host-death family antitoxin [Candidatus Tectomicrobia bacterium]
MVKRLTRTGNSWAVILERALLERAGIDETTPLDVTVDEDRIVVTALGGPRRPQRFAARESRARYRTPARHADGGARVGLRELKAGLAGYVRRVRRGETLLVTSRGGVVAELGPPRAGRIDADEALRVLARRGLLTVGLGNRRGLYRPMSPVGKPGLARRLLDETRGDR